MKLFKICYLIFILFLANNRTSSQSGTPENSRKLISENGVEINYSIAQIGDTQFVTFTIPAASIGKMTKDNMDAILLPQKDGFIFTYDDITVISGAKLKVNPFMLAIEPNATSVIFTVLKVKVTEQNKSFILDKLLIVKK